MKKNIFWLLSFLIIVLALSVCLQQVAADSNPEEEKEPVKEDGEESTSEETEDAKPEQGDDKATEEKGTESDAAAGKDATETVPEPPPKPEEPRISTFPTDTDFMTSFARSGYGIVHLIGIALFGRGPFFITGSGLRRLLSLLFNTVVLMALCYNSSLSGKNVTGIQLVLLYVRQFFGRFMWLALPTALTQFFGGLMIVQIYDPFTAVVMTPSRMRSMPALCDIFLLFRRVGRFFLEYCLPFVIMLPCIIFTEIYTSSFDDYTAYGYALGFIFWLIREAVGKKFVATFWLMIFAELAAAISWLLPAF